MWFKLIICNILIAIVFCEHLDNSDYYTAAAVEYGFPIPKDEVDITAERFVLNNLNEYLKFIEMAKEHNVDILVFPEATFNYFGTRKLSIDHSIELPNPDDKIAPYEHDEYSDILQKLSKHSKDHQMYVLVNLVERVRCDGGDGESCKRKEAFNLYNTNVVFDRHGRVISKYQKVNLFLEPDMEVPETIPLSTFTTDFNVKFGHFICFDILFKEPALKLVKSENVTNILYPSMWFSDLPFLTAVQTHSAWAYANNVNLISSGANNPHLSNTGSGIYLGRNSNHHKVMAGKDSKYLIISKVPKDPNNYNAEKLKITKESTSNIILLNNIPKFTPNEMQSLKVAEMWSDLGVMKWDIEEDLKKPQKICVSNDVCCKYDLKIKHLNVPDDKIAYRYKLVANSTTRAYGYEQIGGEIYCAIVSCTSDKPNSCGKHFKNNEKYVPSIEFESIKITAFVPRDDDFKDTLFMPNSLDTSILPLDTNQFKFNKIGVIEENGKSYNKYRMESKEKLQNILTFGIFGRNFANDEKVPID